jgi:hypothetical protein
VFFIKNMDKAILAIVAIVAAGLLGIAVVEGDNIVKQIQAFAAGCPGTTIAINARTLLRSLAFNFYFLI